MAHCVRINMNKTKTHRIGIDIQTRNVLHAFVFSSSSFAQHQRSSVSEFRFFLLLLLLLPQFPMWCYAANENEKLRMKLVENALHRTNVERIKWNFISFYLCPTSFQPTANPVLASSVRQTRCTVSDGRCKFADIPIKQMLLQKETRNTASCYFFSRIV